MFEPKVGTKYVRKDQPDEPEHYIGARVTDTEKSWLENERKRRKLSMSDLIRLALRKLQQTAPRAKHAKTAKTESAS